MRHVQMLLRLRQTVRVTAKICAAIILPAIVVVIISVASVVVIVGWMIDGRRRWLISSSLIWTAAAFWSARLLLRITEIVRVTLVHATVRVLLCR